MPRVPTYDNFTVSPTGLPGARVDTPTVGDAGRQLQEMGQNVSQMGRAAATIATDVQNDANKLRVDDAYTQLQNGVMDLEMGDQGFLRLKGNDALSRPDNKPLDVEYGEKLDAQIIKLRDGLGNDAQKMAFDRMANDTRVSFRRRLDAHTLDQFNVYNQQVQDSRISTSRRDVALNWNNRQQVDRGLESIRGAVAAKFKGAAPEVIADQTVKAISPAHTAVLANAVQANNFQYARDYLAAYGDQMTEDARLNAQKVIDINQVKYDGEMGARQVIAASGTNWTLKSVDEQLVKQYGNDPKLLEVARGEARYQDGLRKDEKTQTEITLLKPVQDAIGYSVLQGNVIPRQTAEALLAPLRNTSPELYLKAAKEIDAQNDHVRAERTAAEDRARRLHEEAVKVGIQGDEVSTGTWYTYKTNPNALRTADLFDLRKQGLIGQKHFDDLASDQQKLRNGKIEENTILGDKAAVDIVLKEAKIAVDGKNISVNEATNLAMFYQAFNDRLNAAGGSKQLTQNQKVDIARGLLKEVSVERKWWFDTSKRVFQLKIEDVPAKSRMDIESALRANGLPVNNQNILRMYQMGQ